MNSSHLYRLLYFNIYDHGLFIIIIIIIIIKIYIKKNFNKKINEIMLFSKLNN